MRSTPNYQLAGNRARGIPCPECQSPIVVDIADMISRGKVVCAMCRLELFFNKDENAESLEVLKGYQKHLQEVGAHLNQSSPAEAVTSGDSEEGGVGRRRRAVRSRRRQRRR